MTATRRDLFVRRSILLRTRSRWLITHALVPLNAMSAGPSPTRGRATTRLVFGETRIICAPWSSATHTDPPPVQMLYAALVGREMRLTSLPEVWLTR